ncbi:MAG: recombinase family protein [Chloroflexi bacterium]|nr:recombinase family protein [Chloroflexota bacterium]
MRAVGYFRPGAGGTSGHALPPAPRRQFEQYCRDRGHELAQLIGPDGNVGPDASARGLPLSDEQQFAVLEGLCADERRPDLVLIPDATHLAKDLETCVDRVLSLESRSVEIRCTGSPLTDVLESALRLLMPSPGTARRLSRIREAIGSKARRGEVLGRTPYGYRVGLDGLLEPVPSEAEVVKQIFGLYAGAPDAGGRGGREDGGRERLGLRRIAARLNGSGVRTRSGGLWTPASLAGVLKNPAYAGDYKRGGVRIPRNHPAIVDRATFDRARGAMSRWKPRRRPRSTEGYLLAGLAECASCHRTMHGLLRERKWVRKDGTESRRSYRYYECPSRPGNGPAHASWRAEKLEKAVFDRVGRIKELTAVPDAQLRVVVTGEPASRDIDAAVRRLRSTVIRVAAGSAQMAEFTAARALLRKLRTGGGAAAPVRMSVRDALDAVQSADRDLARRAITALIARVSASTDEIDVRLRLDAP